MNIEQFMELSKYEKKTLLEAADENLMLVRWGKYIVVAILALTTLGLGGCPMYNVWTEGLKGQAELARAEQNRQIVINEAKAVKESATYKADAEVERARGIDGANKIIAKSLGGPEGYLRYLYIDALQSTSCETIYVPTEAGLPILEATRRSGHE